MRSEAFELWVKLAAGCEKEEGASSPPAKRFLSQGLKHQSEQTASTDLRHILVRPSLNQLQKSRRKTVFKSRANWYNLIRLL